MSYIGISKNKIDPVAIALNKLLSSYSVYYQNLRSCHWNVKGQSFFQLHQEFETIYNDAKLKIDDIAERILTVGHEPIGKMSAYLNLSKIQEVDSNFSDVKMVKSILKDQTTLISQMREVVKKAAKIGDEGTVDLVSGMIGDSEKRTWMLGAWLNKNI